MPGFAEKLWEMGRTPSQHLSLLVFGLVALLTGLISRSMLAVVGSAGGMAALSLAASFLVGVGGFFVTLALFLRSEEHTSELHHTVISYAVFCLKKKSPDFEETPARIPARFGAADRAIPTLTHLLKIP